MFIERVTIRRAVPGRQGFDTGRVDVEWRKRCPGQGQAASPDRAASAGFGSPRQAHGSDGESDHAASKISAVNKSLLAAESQAWP